MFIKNNNININNNLDNLDNLNNLNNRNKCVNEMVSVINNTFNDIYFNNISNKMSKSVIKTVDLNTKCINNFPKNVYNKYILDMVNNNTFLYDSFYNTIYCDSINIIKKYCNNNSIYISNKDLNTIINIIVKNNYSKFKHNINSNLLNHISN